MARFSGIPSVPMDNIDPQLARVLMSLKENVELLTNQRGEFDSASAALTQGALGVPPISNVAFTALTARGTGASISGLSVPTLSDYVKLLQDFQLLAYDVTILRNTVNELLTQLRS